MDILFVFAMKEEFSYLLDKFPERKEEKIGEYYYYKIEYPKMNLYILHGGIGLINTSIALTKILNKIKPKFIINTGTAGVHDINLNVGDFILAKEVININEIETKKKELNEGSNSLDWELNTFTEDEEKDFKGDIKIYYGDEGLIKTIKNIGLENNIKIIEGRVGSGDIWNKEKDRIKYFNEKYLTLCEEMEIYSIYKISKQENIPSIGIKIISNNTMNGQEYDRNVMKRLDEFLYKIILKLSE